MRRRVNLRESLKVIFVYDSIVKYAKWIIEIDECETKEQLSSLLKERMGIVYRRIDKTTFNKVNDVQKLKERIVVNVVGKLIFKKYQENSSAPGPKSDRMRRFFDDLTTEPKDVYDAMDEYGLSYNTIKCHKRYDPFSDRGLTKIKRGAIFRLSK